MAGEWIKMRTNLWDDPRISKLCDITDQPEAAIVGGLYWLWATADEHTESGILPGLTTRAIDRKTGVQGLGQGLVDIGWLADHPEGVRIVGFEEHNGTSAKKRCQTAKRVEKHKAGNAPVTQQALPESADSVSDALPREEKRREEVNQDQKHVSPPSADDQPAKKTTSPNPLSSKPPNVSAEVWADFVAHRKGKSKLTAKACELIAAKLAGHPDPDAVLNQSIENGWTGIFPEKVHAASKQSGGQGSNSAVDQVKRAIAEREARSAQAQPIHDRQALVEDDGDLRPPLDVEFRRVG